MSDPISRLSGVLERAGMVAEISFDGYGLSGVLERAGHHDYLRTEKAVAVEEPPPPRAVIVTGIGRSGTGYVAEVLRKSAMRSSHKHVFHAGVLNPCVRCLKHLDVEVSGFAMPHLDDRKFRPYPVVQVVRNPLPWLNSWKQKRYARSYIDAHLPDSDVAPFVEPDPDGIATDAFFTDALRTWFLWNLAIARRAIFFFRVEDMSPDDVEGIALLAGVTAWDPKHAIEAVPTDFNTAGSPTHPRPSWRSLPRSEWRTRARQLATCFGYRT